MTQKSFCIAIIAMLFVAQTTMAQSMDSKPEGTKMNIVKVNLMPLAIKNFSLQYERVLTKRLSVAMGFRLMPNTGLPLQNTFLNLLASEGPDAVSTIANLKVSNMAITPELRLYVGKKGYGRGFYFAPYYRYATFKSSELPFDYENNMGETNTIKLNGKITTHTGGIMMGAQWFLGDYVSLDWWIGGLHFGTNKGVFSGKASVPLTAEEQADLKANIDGFELPVGTITSTVNAQGATINLSGPWAGVRAGLSIGFRF